MINAKRERIKCQELNYGAIDKRQDLLTTELDLTTY